MKRYIPLLATVVVFTVSFLLDIWSTSLFLNSPNCVESNPLFAPFSKTPLLLGQMYVLSWFFFVGISGYVHLMIRHFKGPLWVELLWYWLLWASSIYHIQAVFHNLAVLPLCWA